MKKLGIIGGGQLGLMLVEAAKKLNISTIVLDPTPQSPAAIITDQIVGNYKDPGEIRKLAKKSQYLTFEIESANAQVLKELESEGAKVQPSPKSLEIIQDKLNQKQFLLANNLPVVEFTDVKSASDIKKTAKYLGYPLILKARFHGYDGRGNAVIENEKEIGSALIKLKGKKLYLEKYLKFKKELAIQVVRSKSGKVKTFPLVETIQKNNICHIVKFPANIPQKVHKEAQNIAEKTILLLEGAGVFAIEMFQTKDDRIMINEIAPRVHNSGHWTIEGCETSQFEEHLRAVCNMSLGSTKPKTKAAVMINILGNRNGHANPKGIEKAKNVGGIFVHIYGKKETRIERKMGHITALAKNLETALKNAQRARGLITI